MISRTKTLTLGILLSLMVIGSGTVEDWYGRTNYATDAVAYLDISRAIGRADAALAVNPYWGIGYPALLSLFRGIFSGDPGAEWTAVHVLNLLIFAAAFWSFLFLLEEGLAYLGHAGAVEGTANARDFVFALGTFIFLYYQLDCNNVSRISPDLLVSCLFFLSCVFLLRLCARPTVRTAVLLGLLLGVGFWVKAVFLPLAVGILVTAFLHAVLRTTGDERRCGLVRLPWTFLALGLIALPYTAALSRHVGHPSFGESGGLNYAWIVNGMPHYADWQGGDPRFGLPLHPTRLVAMQPPAFAFPEPFHVTYPPWFNAYYWYAGYHPFFSLHNELHTLKDNGISLLKYTCNGPHLIPKFAAKVVGIVLLLIFLRPARIWLGRFATLWPLLLPAVAGIAIYLPVLIDTRYIVGPLIILATAPFLALFAGAPTLPRPWACALVALVAVVIGSTLVRDQREVLQRAVHFESYEDDKQWKIGSYLRGIDVRPSDRVAAVKEGSGMQCTWAYVARLRIVAEIGNDAFDPGNQAQDFQLFAASPGIQQTEFARFKEAGATWVVAPDAAVPLQGPGWQVIPGTRAWIHRLD